MIFLFSKSLLLFIFMVKLPLCSLYPNGSYTTNITNVTNFNPNWKNRVIGGFPCTTEEFPFVVLIFKIKSGTKAYRACGGSLLTSRYVLTAAHCIGTEELMVLAGINNPKDKPIRRLVLEAIVHPQYDHDSLINDIALLYLEEPIKASDHVIYTKIPNIEYKDSYLESYCSTVLVMGWGYTGDEYNPDSLPSLLNPQCAFLPTITYRLCKDIYRHDNDIYEGNMCTLSLEGKDACQGDSGGPLLCDKYQIGIVSWGVGCGDSSSPGVYTRVDKYLDFIKSQLYTNRREPRSSDSHCKYIHIGNYIQLHIMTITICLINTLNILY